MSAIFVSMLLYAERLDLLIESIALRESEKMAMLMSCLLSSLCI